MLDEEEEDLLSPVRTDRSHTDSAHGSSFHHSL